MRLLGTPFLAEDVRFSRHVLIAELFTDELAYGADRIFAEVERIGTHVSNQADAAFGADVHAFIELLGDSHGARGAEA